MAYYEGYYNIKNSKEISERIQKYLFNKGYGWIGSGKNIWFPSEMKGHVILISEDKKMYNSKVGNLDIKYEKELFLEEQLEFEFG